MHVTFMDTVKINPTANARYIHGYGEDQSHWPLISNGRDREEASLTMKATGQTVPALRLPQSNCHVRCSGIAQVCLDFIIFNCGKRNLV